MKPLLKLLSIVIFLSQSVFAQATDSSTYVKLFLPDGCVNATVMLQVYSVDSVPNFTPSICSESSAPFQFDLLASDQDYILSIIGHDTIHINYSMSSYSLIEDDVTLIDEGSIYQVSDTVILAGDTLINTLTNVDSIGSHFFIDYVDLYSISPDDPTDPTGGLTDSIYTELTFPDGCTNATIYLSYLNEDSVLSINPIQCSQSSAPFVLSELSLDQEFVLNIIAYDTINLNYSLSLISPISTIDVDQGAIYQIFDSIITGGDTSINVFSNIDTIGPNIVINYSDIFVSDSIIDSFPWVSLPGCQACSDEVNNTLLQHLSDAEMDTSQVVLILEQTGLDISITDSYGTEFVPTVMDSFIVFSPFNLEDQYAIIVDQSEISLEWLILLPDGSTISEGEIASIDSTINNGMFTINSTLSIGEENTKPLEVYNITYFNLLGEEIKTLENGLYIKVMQTNKGQVAEKVYHSK